MALAGRPRAGRRDRDLPHGSARPRVAPHPAPRSADAVVHAGAVRPRGRAWFRRASVLAARHGIPGPDFVLHLRLAEPVPGAGLHDGHGHARVETPIVLV